MTKEDTVELVAHQIAAGLHGMLALRQMTLAQFKNRLDEIGFEKMHLLDALLSGSPDAGEIDVGHLAVLGYALDCRWNFNVQEQAPHTEFTNEGD